MPKFHGRKRPNKSENRPSKRLPPLVKGFRETREGREREIAKRSETADWVKLIDIRSQLAVDRGRGFKSAAKSRIGFEIALQLENDLRSGYFRKDGPHFLLLSSEYSATELTAAELVKVIDTAFSNWPSDKLKSRLQSLSDFFFKNCWLKRSIARRWLKSQGYRLNPPPKTTAAVVLTTVAAEGRCRNWLIDEMNANETPPDSKAVYQAAAKERFNVGTQPFRRAWHDAMKKTKRFNWGLPGRRPKKTSATQ